MKARLVGHPFETAWAWLKAIGRGAGASLAIVFLIALAPLACATLKTMSGSFATCEKADLGAVLEDVPAQLAADFTTAGVSATDPVLTILSKLVAANLPGIEADLTTIGIKVGLDTLQCAYAAIESVLAPPPTATPNAAELATQTGLARYRAWLAKQ